MGKRYLLQCVLVLLLICGEFGIQIVASIPVGLIHDFTSYSIYFHSDRISSCAWNEKNVTFNILMKAIDRCVNPEYFPTLLTPKHVAWKTVPTQKSSGPPNRTTISHNKNQSFDISATINQSEYQPVYEKTSDNKTEIVYPYLVFALVLPQHPYSINLVHTLRIVAPMYPGIDIVIGSGYEFEDMCSQFGIRSFPRLLLFKKGILSNTVREPVNPPQLAEILSKWTRSLPRALPYVPIPHSPNKQHRDQRDTDFLRSTENTLIELFTAQLTPRKGRRYKKNARKDNHVHMEERTHVSVGLDPVANSSDGSYNNGLNISSNISTVDSDGLNRTGNIVSGNLANSSVTFLDRNHSSIQLVDIVSPAQLFESILGLPPRFLSMKYSVEPIIGTVDELVPWDCDGSLLILAGCYVVIRGLGILIGLVRANAGRV